MPILFLLRRARHRKPGSPDKIVACAEYLLVEQQITRPQLLAYTPHPFPYSFQRSTSNPIGLTAPRPRRALYRTHRVRHHGRSSPKRPRTSGSARHLRLAISGYALAVVVGALRLTAAVTRFERKPAPAVPLVLFIAGNSFSAAAPDYWTHHVRPHHRPPWPWSLLRHRRRGRRQHVAPAENPAPSPSCHRPTAANVLGVPRDHAGPGGRLALHLLGHYRHRRTGPRRHPGPGPEHRPWGRRARAACGAICAFRSVEDLFSIL